MANEEKLLKIPGIQRLDIPSIGSGRPPSFAGGPGREGSGGSVSAAEAYSWQFNDAVIDARLSRLDSRRSLPPIHNEDIVRSTQFVRALDAGIRERRRALGRGTRDLDPTRVFY